MIRTRPALSICAATIAIGATLAVVQTAAAEPPSSTATGPWHLAYEHTGPAQVGAGTRVSISGDGRYTVFDSTEKLTDDAVGSQRYVYRRDLADGTIELVSTHARETDAIGASYGATVSSDGRLIAFVTTDVDTFDEAPGSGARAHVALKDMATGSMTLISWRHSEIPELETLAAVPEGDAAFGDSGSPFISADGRFVAFTSNVPGVNNLGTETGTKPTVELYDTTTGDVTNLTPGVSADPTSPVSANGASGQPALSADGRFVVFASTSTNLGVASTTPPSGSTVTPRSHIYRLDRETAELVQVSVAAGDTGATFTTTDGDSIAPSISADGRRIAFLSGAKNLLGSDEVAKTSTMSDAYVRDMEAGVTHRVSLMMLDQPTPSAKEKADHEPAIRRTRFWREAVGGADTVAMSADGASVIVSSIGPMLEVRGDCRGCQQFIDDNDGLDVYSVSLSDDARPRTVQPISARRNAEDAVAPDWVGLSTFLTSSTGDGDSIADGVTPVSADGRTIVFGSLAQDLRGWDETRRVTPGDTTFLEQPSWRPGAEVITVPHFRDGGFPGSLPPQVRMFTATRTAFAHHLHLTPWDEEELLSSTAHSVTYATRAKALPGLSEPPALTSTTGSLNTATITPGTSGVIYGVTVQTLTAGSAVLALDLREFALDGPLTVPAGWSRAAADVAGTVTLTTPHLDAGTTTTLSVRLKEDDTATPASAFAAAEVNGDRTISEVLVQPAAPSCTGADVPPDVIAGVEGVLKGVQCRTPDWRPLAVTAAHGTVTTSAIGILTYTPEGSYRGEDVITVGTKDTAGRWSTTSQVVVNVVAPAEAVADDYSTAADTPLRVTAEQGLLSNDRLPTERALWNVQAGDAPDHGTVEIDTRTGAFTYTPPVGFRGDATFRYRPYAAATPASEGNVVTVTIHVL